jgi:hypothetical protein
MARKRVNGKKGRSENGTKRKREKIEKFKDWERELEKVAKES